MENKVSVVPGASEKGFRGPGGVRGMGNRVSVVPGSCEAWKAGFMWSREQTVPDETTVPDPF
jgi:hypothetical protein